MKLKYLFNVSEEATMIPIEYDMIIFKEDETYVAYCPEIDVSSCGNSVQHAREMRKTEEITG
ncbi:MAG TPA: hypothetical protein DD725_04385 [Deltaproteobacteria bacterium]|nr:hypothetical protein [Deltaproteobacteria bacterium]